MSSSTAPHVFISVGHGLSDVQERLVTEVELCVLRHGIEPMTLGRTVEIAADPIRAIRRFIETTIGTIVIALPRLVIEVGAEYPATTHSAAIQPRAITTVWNQIEAAMTLQARHPLLILRQGGLFSEGILDPGIFPCHDVLLDTSIETSLARVRKVVEEWLSSLPQVSCVARPNRA